MDSKKNITGVESHRSVITRAMLYRSAVFAVEIMMSVCPSSVHHDPMLYQNDSTYRQNSSAT